MSYENLLVETSEGVARITINRPTVRNALNGATLDELLEVFGELEADDSVRAMVLTGAGDRAFVSGADIKEMRDKTPLEPLQWSELGHQVADAIEQAARPVIAAVNGFAPGGGCELALACDFIVASDAATFGQPEVKLGILPGWGGTQRLARVVGKAWAKRLILTGEIIDAETALRIGLVTQVVPAAHLLEIAVALARQIAERAPVAVRLAKHAIEAGRDPATGAALERQAFAVCFSTADRQEGMAAFVEKRAPVFAGR